MKTIWAEKCESLYSFDDEETGVFFIGTWAELVLFARQVFGPQTKVEMKKAA